MKVLNSESPRVTLRRASIIAAAWLVGLLLLAPGLTSPFDKEMEARSCTWVEDVAQAGNWLMPLDIYHRPCLKPPLFYWLGAIVSEITGGRVDPPRCRIVSLVSAASLATITMVWTAGRIGGFEGWLAFCILISTYAFAARATSTLVDMLFSLLVLSVYYAIYPLMEGSISPWRAIAAGLLLGFAILTKGPLALVLCTLAGLIYLLMWRGVSLRVLIRWPWPWQVLGIAWTVALLWYVPALKVGQWRLASVMMNENSGHFLPAWMGGTGEAARPVYYILWRVIGGSLPWCLLIVPTIIALASGAIRKELLSPLLYQLAMMIAVVLFFSLASAKRDEYILPAMPALSIVAATAFAIDPTVAAGGRWAVWLRRMLLGGAAISMAAFIMLAFLVERVGTSNATLRLNLQASDLGYARLFADGLARVQPPFLLLTGAALLGVLIVASGLWRARDRVAAAGLWLMVMAGVLIFNGVLRPRLAQARSPNQFAAAVRARIGDAPLYLVRGEDVPFSLYYGRPIPSLPAVLPAGAFLVARPRDLTVLLPLERRRLRCVMRSNMVGEDRNEALYKIETGLFNSVHSKSRSSTNVAIAGFAGPQGCTRSGSHPD
jgi:4-amino-4-deoxy-L-arabinose transferase-like glycosyltransferase